MGGQEREVRDAQSRAEKTVIHLHIPKTAGTTLKQIADRHYPRQHVYTIQVDGTIDEFKSLTHSRKSRIRLLRGHQGYGLHEYLPGGATYFTVLRDPIERVISYYYSVRRTPHHYCYDMIMSNDMGLKDFVESRADPMVDNGQTRLLSGMMESGWEFGFGQCTEDVLEAAKENLCNNFAVVGLTEEFDKTILLLREALGWRHLFYARRNVAANRPKKEDLSQDALEVVTEVSLLDLELYEYARKLFQHQVHRQGASFARKVARFQLVNRQLNPFISLWWNLRNTETWKLAQKQLRHVLR
jgi:hypothetical protein